MRTVSAALGFIRTVVVLATLSVCTGTAYAQSTWRFSLPEQPLADALRAVGGQASTNVFFEPGLVTGVKASALSGSFTLEDALNRLLAGTGLRFRYVDAKTIAIEPALVKTRSEALRDREPEFKRVRLAQATTDDDALPNHREDPHHPNPELEEIVVTGTHIRGAINSASPIQVFSREEIEMSGVGTVQDFVQRIPQNFKGGASEGTVNTIAGGLTSAGNALSGSSINLRGLGNDSTLILINGRRFVPGSIRANWVDISLIPLSAVERVEVLTDGAAATYGSDAIGGVVNFILRSDFQGAETRARYGVGDHGTPEEYLIGQILGHRWESGSALLSYEYFSHSELEASDRDFMSNFWSPFQVLPNQRRHGAYVHLQQDVTSEIELFTDGTYSKRTTEDVQTNPALSFRADNHGKVDAFSASIGARSKLGERLGFEVSAGYAESEVYRKLIGFTGATTAEVRTNADVLSVDAILNGDLGVVGASKTRFALGGQYREEGLRSADLVRGGLFIPKRDVLAAFMEMQIPLLGPSTEQVAPNRLELSLAVRTEEYSDFGSTTNPKVGLIWQPMVGLKFRGTYGTSFRAPVLDFLNPRPVQVAAQTRLDPTVGAQVPVLFVFGGNPELLPEEATTWTAGVDWRPGGALEGFQANLTYYSIDYENRITTAQVAGFGGDNTLQSEEILGPQVVQRDQPLDTVLDWISRAQQYLDITRIPGGVSPNAIHIIVDSRFLNLSEMNTSGVDLGLSFRTPIGRSTIETGVDLTYILDLDSQFGSSAPAVQLVNTAYNPVDLKLRARAVLAVGGFTLSAFVNHVDSYHDIRSSAPAPVEAWTTGDLTLGYKFVSEGAWLDGFSTQLSVLNVTNEDPPFVASGNALFPVTFDGANANLLGRFISLQFAKKW